jgi:K+-sensing histidine kinase KdpD
MSSADAVAWTLLGGLAVACPSSLAIAGLALWLARSAARLRLEQSRRKAILDHVEEAVVVTDEGGRVVVANRAAGRALGQSEQQLSGLTTTDLLHTAQRIGGLRFQRLPADSLQLVVLQAESQAPRRAQWDTEQLDQVSHSLRGPLTTLAATVEILQSDYHQLSPAERSHFLTGLLRSVKQLERLIGTLLDEAWLRGGRLRISREPTSVARLMEDARPDVQLILDGRRQTVAYRLPADMPVVSVDAARFRQALLNLIMHASTVSPPGSRLGVEVKSETDEVRVIVRDSSPGLSHSDTLRAFNEVAALCPPDGRPGIRLGLSLVRALAELHGGSVGVEPASADGGGLWFGIPLGGQEKVYHESTAS